MRIPCEKFVRYLLLTKHSDKEVIDTLTSFSMPRVGTIYLIKLREEIEERSDDELLTFLTDRNDAVLSKMHRSDIDPKWISPFHMEEIHSGSENYSNAFKIFSDSKRREYINIYIMCDDLTNEELAEIYERKFGDNVSEEDLSVYKEYFFDINIMNAVDWQKYIIQFPPRLRVLYEAAPLKRSKYIQWKMGDHVNVDPYYIFNELSRDFFFLARDAHLDKKGGWQDDAVKFANVALGAGDRAARSTKSTGKNHQLEMVKLLEEPEDIPSFDDLCIEDDEED